VIEGQEIVVVAPPPQNVQENHEQRNQQENFPLFNDDYSNDLRKKKER
jgi:hypothetical protein